MGDSHNEFGYILEALGQVTPSALLFVGDLDLNQPFAHVCREIRQYVPELTIGYVHGNHDSDSYEKWVTDNTMVSRASSPLPTVSRAFLCDDWVGRAFHTDVGWTSDSSTMNDLFDKHQITVEP